MTILTRVNNSFINGLLWQRSNQKAKMSTVLFLLVPNKRGEIKNNNPFFFFQMIKKKETTNRKAAAVVQPK